MKMVTKADIPPHKKMLDLEPSFAEDEDNEMAPTIRYLLVWCLQHNLKASHGSASMWKKKLDAPVTSYQLKTTGFNYFSCYFWMILSPCLSVCLSYHYSLCLCLLQQNMINLCCWSHLDLVNWNIPLPNLLHSPLAMSQKKKWKNLQKF